jgi:hypothetical protein
LGEHTINEAHHRFCLAPRADELLFVLINREVSAVYKSQKI